MNVHSFDNSLLIDHDVVDLERYDGTSHLNINYDSYK